MGVDHRGRPAAVVIGGTILLDLYADTNQLK
jgi:hypothetical protein